MIYITKQDEMLDGICYRHYGQASGYVEKVLEANYRLASYGIVLPIGLRIILPELGTQTPEQRMINLWD